MLVAAVVLLAALPPLAAAQPPRVDTQLSIYSDNQEANTRTGVVVATGNVRIEYPARKVVATADKAVYYQRDKKIVLSGNVRAVQDKNRIDAQTVTYLLTAGVFQAEPEKGKQVKTIYTVPPEEEARPSSTPR